MNTTLRSSPLVGWFSVALYLCFSERHILRQVLRGAEFRPMTVGRSVLDGSLTSNNFEWHTIGPFICYSSNTMIPLIGSARACNQSSAFWRTRPRPQASVILWTHERPVPPFPEPEEEACERMCVVVVNHASPSWMLGGYVYGVTSIIYDAPDPCILSSFDSGLEAGEAADYCCVPCGESQR